MKNDPVSLKHRPFLTPIWLSGLAGFVALCVCVFAVWEWGTADSTTLVIVREEGQEKAQALARLLGDAQGAGRIGAIYVSSAAGNQSTAAPLAARLHIVPVVAPDDHPKRLAHRLLRENSGGRVLIVGSAATVPRLIAALTGAENITNDSAADHGVMYIISVPRIGHANFVRLTY
jgi:broad specificity phosphatase PhoE